jgi:hypothetical protein
MRESSSDSVAVNLYHRSFLRCQAIIAHVAQLTDGVALLTQATESLLEGKGHARIYWEGDESGAHIVQDYYCQFKDGSSSATMEFKWFHRVIGTSNITDISD